MQMEEQLTAAFCGLAPLEPIRSADGARSKARDSFEPFKNMREVSDQGRGAHSSFFHYHSSYN